MYFQDGSASFADVVVNYTQGPGVALQHANPTEALGVPGGSVNGLQAEPRGASLRLKDIPQGGGYEKNILHHVTFTSCCSYFCGMCR